MFGLGVKVWASEPKKERVPVSAITIPGVAKLTSGAAIRRIPLLNF
jgi:hypothetical protein